MAANPYKNTGNNLHHYVGCWLVTFFRNILYSHKLGANKNYTLKSVDQ